MCLQVKQARTAARYEKMVLRANEWMVEQGYAAFCEVVEESETRYTVKLLAVEICCRCPLPRCYFGSRVRGTWGRVSCLVLFCRGQ